MFTWKSVIWSFCETKSVSIIQHEMKQLMPNDIHTVCEKWLTKMHGFVGVFVCLMQTNGRKPLSMLIEIRKYNNPSIIRYIYHSPMSNGRNGTFQRLSTIFVQWNWRKFIETELEAIKRLISLKWYRLHWYCWPTNLTYHLYVV